MIVIGVITVLFAAVSARYVAVELGLLGGLASSLALAFVGLKLTAFERTTEGDFYTPNTTIGVLLSLILVARIIYRLSSFYPSPNGQVPGHPPFQSPLTAAAFGLLLGYYLAYYAGVLIHAKRWHSEARPKAV